MSLRERRSFLARRRNCRQSAADPARRILLDLLFEREGYGVLDGDGAGRGWFSDGGA